MYRIELSPGEETAFRSIEELAVAIRRGVVTSKARIWHNASSKWLPIQFHPHYKTAATMPLTQADLVVGPPVAPLSSLSLPDPSGQASRVTPFSPVLPSAPPESPAPTTRVTPFKPASPYHQPEPRAQAAPASEPLIEPVGFMSLPEPLRPEPARPPAAKPLPPKPQRVMQSPPEPAPVRKKKLSRARKPSRRALRVAFIGALLIGGVHVLVSSGVALRPEALRAHRRLIAVPPEAINRDTPRTVAAVIPVLRNSSVPGAAAKSPRSSAQPQPTTSAPRTPAPTLRAVTPVPPGGTPVPGDSIPALEPAPAVQIPVPPPAATDSLASKVVDSSGKEALKGILRAVSGAPANQNQKSPTKR
jgi:hypothetical protein